LKIKVDGSDIDYDGTPTVAAGKIEFTLEHDLSEEIPSAGLKVEISYEAELKAADYVTTITLVNSTTTSRTFNKKIADAIVRVSKQVKDGDETEYTFDVDTYN
jgi:hypothetical protein